VALIALIADLQSIGAPDEPAYEAHSILIAKAANPGVGGHSSQVGDSQTLCAFLRTQASRLKSDGVLRLTVAHHSIAILPEIAASMDPEADLRRMVKIVNDGGQLRVSLKMANAEHAARIVNILVECYFRCDKLFRQSEVAARTAALNDELKMLEGAIAYDRLHLKMLAQKGSVETAGPGIGLDGDSASRHKVARPTQQQIQKVVEQLLELELKLIETQAIVDVYLREAAKLAELGAMRLDGEQLDARVDQEFKKDPSVEAVLRQIAEIDEQPAGNDRGATAHETRQKRRKLVRQYDDLWYSKYQEIVELVLVANDIACSGRTIDDLKAKVNDLRRKRDVLTKTYNELKRAQKSGDRGFVEKTYLNCELGGLLRKHEETRNRLAGSERTAQTGRFFLALLERASVPGE
jgi:hypothetical protein